MKGGIWSGVMWAALGAVAAPAAAQAPADGGETITVIGRRPAYNQESVRSATRTETPLRDTPQSVSVVTNDLIEDQAMRSMADVVRYVPGVSMGQGEGHRDAPTLRGNSSTADFFVDGVRDDVQYYRDLYNAERVEVLKGPNAMIFGRGGGGGVINRVTEWANWSPAREASLQIGSHDQYRAGLDLGAAFSQSAAGRFNAVYEDSGSYRDHVELERYGLNPTTAFRISEHTQLRLGYEYFRDERTVDRGVPSQNGRPYAGSRSAYFGNPELSYSEAEVHFLSGTIEHAFTPNLRLRNRAQFADYQKFYQNVHANSAVNASGDVNLQAYNSGADRANMFNQTDLIWEASTGAIGHTILAGVEFGRQETDNTRSPSNNGAGVVNIANPTTFAAPIGGFGNPLNTNNRVTVNLAAIYLQDQIALSDQFEIIAGVRFDHFDLEFDDRNAANADADSKDEFVSPRLGAVYKPAEPISFYASYSVSYLPQSGDQFNSLPGNAATLDPEEFENMEVGVKWDLTPELALTAAIYQLDRSNTRANDPLNPGSFVLVGEQRSEGVELGVVGSITERWEVIGGYAYQDVEITRGANAGNDVALTPAHVFSLWNNYRFTPRWGAGLGITHQSESFTSIGNAVTLPEFTRVDAALFVALTDRVEAQLNIENLFNETYWATAHNDNNITPGSPTAARFALRTRF